MPPLDRIDVSPTSAHERHRLLRKAHDEALLTYEEDSSSDQLYTVTTAEGRRLSLSPAQVAPFCDGLAAGYAAAREAAELDRSLKTLLTATGAAQKGCRHCGAPLTSTQALRCNMCSRSQEREG